MNATKKDLPQRYSEASFRRFEDAIAIIVQKYPQVVHFVPREMQYSPVTFSCRLRDAMNSFAEYKWKSAIDWSTFMNIRNEIVVSQQADKVIVGKVEDVRRRAITAITPIIESNDLDRTTALCSIHCSTLEQKKLLCELAAKHAFAGPLDVTGISNDDATWLEDNFDVNIKLNDKGHHTII